ncbi:MAG: histidinol dehydrogenase [Thermodesulfovibrio sp.]|uniref:histidinol dehydrogenase n=1 Tax=Thermodesulfovibrio sp. 1176 TaxID=3043424 RepID=UPI002482AB6B|nr:histidinol dehydrogenase [Thermodesulfovibrio sp. 1176]MDI1471750.1 histidinol dehydrogenase [Thermodesulfovibrio sp. 1176]MDI6713641.1 histidinol dehydrogenase [Thermodesulfovibrio sp.]
MLIIKDKTEIQRFIKRLCKRSTSEPEIEENVKKILNEVKKKGYKALIKYTKLFDRHGLPLKIEPEEIKEKAKEVSKGVLNALKFAAQRIRKFHERQIEKSWKYKEGDIVLGQIIRPLHRIGAYVPGGKASYPSTVLMNIIPAQVAGVSEIAVCVPTPRGEINPTVCAALELLDIKEVYRIGGAQAIGALAYGTETIKKVDKIVGPGNIYVATAKKLVFGEVDIDMIAGPSEIMIVADSSANPAFIASDMLSQAEHDEMASSILVTTSEKLAYEVKKEISKQLKTLPKAEIAKQSLKNFGAIVLVQSLEEATEVVNKIAPEHLEIMTENSEELLPMVKNAGAIFLGPWSTEPIGDYVAGPNHTLPTGGTARFFSPLGVYDFIKRSSLIKIGKKGFEEIAPYVERLATIEGLQAHANTVKIRKPT